MSISIWSTVSAPEFKVMLLLLLLWIADDVVWFVVAETVVAALFREFGVWGEIFVLLDVVVGVFGETVVAFELGAVRGSFVGLGEEELGLDVVLEGMIAPAALS